MCGIVGIVGERLVNQELYDALTVLQHRGQDAAGMVTSDGHRMHLRKATGLVQDVFQQRHIDRLAGNVGIGHVRYPTAGSSSSAEAQPMYVNSPYGVTLAHNGNLTNAESLRADLFREDLRHVNTSSDSEVLLNIFAHELQTTHTHGHKVCDVFEAVVGVHRRCRGAYAAVAMIVGVGIVGFRDPFGIRPLVYGRRRKRDKRGKPGYEYMIASESVALDMLGFELVADVAPGEAVFISERGEITTRACRSKTALVPCIFEQVYLARPDSIIDGVSVYKSRLRMGKHLAKRIRKRYRDDHGIDVVIPVPDTSRTCALSLAQELQVEYREGFVKNRYIGRTFIMPDQRMRQKSVRQKFNTIELEFKGKNVLLVDDSIVRGTTTGQIIQMAREAGARKVFMASASPAIRYPNVYGIDMPAEEELVAFGRSEAQVGGIINADWLIYQRIEDLIESAREGNPAIEQFDCSVFDGRYVTGDIDRTYLDHLSAIRNDAMKQRREAAMESGQTAMELYNQD